MKSLLEYFIGEAASPKDEASEPTDSNNDDSNKDIDADSKDSTADSDDVASDTEDTSNSSDDSSDSTDDTDTTSDEDTSTVADDGGNDDSSSDPVPEEDPKDKEKKLLLYKSLREIRANFNSTADIYDTILSTDIPESNIPTIKVIRKKIGDNIEMLDELLSSSELVKTKTYADLQVIHNIYLGDLNTIDKNLKAFYKLIKPKK